MRRILFGGIVGLCGVIALEWRAAPAASRPGNDRLPMAAAAIRAPAVPDAGEKAGLADAVLARPLFSPGRRPDPVPRTVLHLPRLAGLLLSPHLQLALLQTSDAAGMRPQPTATGGEAAGWKLTALDARGVVLSRGARSVRLALQRAGARPLPPTPMAKVVIMPTKRTNPQLAW